MIFRIHMYFLAHSSSPGILKGSFTSTASAVAGAATGMGAGTDLFNICVYYSQLVSGGTTRSGMKQ
jgi:hypothetical protein